MGFKRVWVSLRIVLTSLCAVILFSACSTTESKTDTTSSTSGKISFSGSKSDLDNRVISSDLSKSAQTNSEDAAIKFAYMISSAFVSSEVKNSVVLSGFIASTAEPGIINGLVARNNSQNLPSITFSPIGVTVDNFAGKSASIAVIGLSLSSSQEGTTSVYQEVYFNLVFEEGWRVAKFSVNDIIGPSGDNSKLSAELAAILADFYLPANDFNVSNEPLVKLPKSNDELTTGTTQPVFAGE